MLQSVNFFQRVDCLIVPRLYVCIYVYVSVGEEEHSASPALICHCAAADGFNPLSIRLTLASIDSSRVFLHYCDFINSIISHLLARVGALFKCDESIHYKSRREVMRQC